MKAPALHAFECWLVGTPERRTTVNARDHGSAKYSYFLDCREWCADLKYIEVRVRKAGSPVTTDYQRHTMQIRQRPEFVAGARVTAFGRPGYIVGTNCSANFDVLFDDRRWPENVHPADIALHPVALLDKLRTLQPDWDSDGAEPPSSAALDVAATVITAFQAHGCLPFEVDADALGGVAVWYESADGSRKVWIASMNSGRLCALRDMSADPKWPQAAPFILSDAPGLAAFIRGETPCKS